MQRTQWRKVMPRWKYFQQILFSKYMQSFKVISSQRHWKMSILILLIYTVSTFLFSEEQILIISCMSNKNQVSLYLFLLFVFFFSLDLNNKDYMQLLVTCIMKWYYECLSLKHLLGGRGNQSRIVICVLCQMVDTQVLWKGHIVVLMDFVVSLHSMSELHAFKPGKSWDTSLNFIILQSIHVASNHY